MSAPLESSWVIYRRMARYAIPYWKVIAASMFALTLFSAADVGFVALMKPLLDGSFVQKDVTTIRWIPLAIVGLFLVRGTMGFASGYGLQWVTQNIIASLRREMFARLMQLPVTYFDRNSTGTILARFNYHASMIASALMTSTHALRELMVFLGQMGLMFYLSWKLTVFVLVAAPLIVMIVRYVNKRIRGLGARMQTTVGRFAETLDETIKGQRVIKIHGAEATERANFEHINQDTRRLTLKVEATSLISGGLTQLIAAFAIASIVYFATLPEMLDEITPGTFVAFLVALTTLMRPIRTLNSVNQSIQLGVTAAREIFSFLAEPAESAGGKSLARAHGQIEFRGVRHRYQADAPEALKGINLVIEPGQTVAFVGKSGSGKSTLLALLPRFYDPTGGQILLDGHDLREYSLAAVRSQIALVDQQVRLFNATVAENIAYALTPTPSEAQMIEAARHAHAWEFIEKLPKGLNTEIGENGVQLSGGQRQRIAIARALLKNAPILILDEATSALDTESERHIQEALEELVRRTHHAGHRPPAFDHSARGPDRGDARGGDCRIRPSRRAPEAKRRLRIAVSHAVSGLSPSRMRAFSDRLQKIWYCAEPPPLVLRPLSWLFVAVAVLRRFWLKRQAQRTHLPVPVIVVGNITVGGSGKTPFVIWLAERLREWGWHPGIVSRGYGGRPQRQPLHVTDATAALECGDEPLLMARRTGCPVVVCPNRVAAVRALIRLGGVDIVISDDGLQHYRLPRDLEIAVVDGARGLGNGWRLPAGPLRESPKRLTTVDQIVVNGPSAKSLGAGPSSIAMRLVGPMAHSLQTGQIRALGDFAGQTVHAVAGIAHPARFFSMLSRLEIKLIVHPFPDHHPFIAQDLDFGDQRPVLMTEKDAVKCSGIKDERMWSVPVSAEFGKDDTARMRELISGLKRGHARG